MYTGRYDNLISGEYQSHVDTFLSSSHTLAEFQEEIEALRKLSSEISSLDDVVFYDMVQLECSDIKTALLQSVNDLMIRLIEQLASDHCNDNLR